MCSTLVAKDHPEPIIPELKRFKQREYLPTLQGHLWKINSGLARTFTLHEDGTTIALGFWGAGHLITFPIDQGFPFIIECLSDVQAYSLPLSDALVSEGLCFRLYQLQSFTVMRRGRLRARVKLFLVWFALQFGQNSKEGYIIPSRPTHQHIADVIGSTRVTVTRVMKELERDNFICWSRGSYFVRYSLLRPDL